MGKVVYVDFSIMRFFILIGLYFIFDASKFLKRRNHERFVMTQNEVLNEDSEEKSRLLRYIEEREKLYKRKDN